MTHDVTPLQQALKAAGYNPGMIDGVFGIDSRAAMQAYQAAHRLTKTAFPDGRTYMALGLPVPDYVPTAPVPKPNLFSQLATLGDIISLLKGRTMTSDQIGGIVRAVLAAAAAYAAGKGWIPGVSPELIATIATAIVGAWSVWTNRASNVVPK